MAPARLCAYSHLYVEKAAIFISLAVLLRRSREVVPHPRIAIPFVKLNRNDKQERNNHHE
jgi:hypothetical protein